MSTSSIDSDAFPEPAGFEDDDIPVIDDSMIDQTVDFEHKMSPVPLASLAIIAACVAAFALQAAGHGLDTLDGIKKSGALDPEAVRQGEVWRLVSATFLHGSFDHILGNLLMLFVLGMACEHGFGRPQFLFLYVMAGLAGSLCSLMGGKVSVGASGAIFGLAGALVVLFVRFKGRLNLRDRRIGFVIAFWAGYQLFLGQFNPAIDNLAHLGGLLGGALMALVLRPAVLDGRDKVAALPLSIAGAAAAGLALLASAVYFLPRLIQGL